MRATPAGGARRSLPGGGGLRRQRVARGFPSPAAVGVLSRDMRDNPMSVAVLGGDPEQRRQYLARMFTSFFRVFTAQAPLVAVDDGTIVGVSGVAPPARASRDRHSRRALPLATSLGPGSPARMAGQLRGWGKRDLNDRHWHLGPLAVDLHLQGRGIGTHILLEHCRRLDEANALGYLETDKDINIHFYERHGYEVIDEAVVIGVHSWFMRRPARPTSKSDSRALIGRDHARRLNSRWRGACRRAFPGSDARRHRT